MTSHGRIRILEALRLEAKFEDNMVKNKIEAWGFTIHAWDDGKYDKTNFIHIYGGSLVILKGG